MSDLNKIFCQQEEAFKSNPFPSLKEKQAVLKNLKKLLQVHANELALVVNEDFSGRSVEETLILELFPIFQAIDYCLKNLKVWMKAKKKKRPWYLKTAKAFTIAQPLGVVGIIVPWNYPIYLALVPLIYALAAGNRVLLKFSEITPKTGGFFSKLFSKTLDAVVIVNGDIKLSQEFAALPFGKLLFTGSSKVGKEVMKNAGANLTPLILELGGKSPVIISKSINTKHLKRLFMGKFLNAGQTCVAPDYIFLPKELEPAFEKEFINFTNKYYPNIAENPQYTNIISPKQITRLNNFLAGPAKGRKSGAV